MGEFYCGHRGLNSLVGLTIYYSVTNTTLVTLRVWYLVKKEKKKERNKFKYVCGASVV